MLRSTASQFTLRRMTPVVCLSAAGVAFTLGIAIGLMMSARILVITNQQDIGMNFKSPITAPSPIFQDNPSIEKNGNYQLVIRQRRGIIQDLTAEVTSPTEGFIHGVDRNFSIFNRGVPSTTDFPDLKRLAVGDTSDFRGAPVGEITSKTTVKKLLRLSRVQGRNQTNHQTFLLKNKKISKEFFNLKKKHEFSLNKIVNGIYWSEELEQMVPKGFNDQDLADWRSFVDRTSVLKIEDGCGRMQNRLITFDNGNRSCCRYRHNNDQIQGEIFSFYLSRLLNIGNLPPSVLANVQSHHSQWRLVSSQVQLAQWSLERPVVLTKYVEDLQPAYIPRHFQSKNNRRLHPINADLFGKSLSELSNLIQWSDLILFDYLTGNLDRIVNNMYNEQWNPEMMKYPTHNLAKSKRTGLLLFLDNESGLLHGYRLLDKYEHFHKSLLDSLCIFRKATAEAVKRLHYADIGKLLKEAFHNGDRGMEEWLPFLPEKSIKTLKSRLETIYNHIQTCEARFTYKLER